MLLDDAVDGFMIHIRSEGFSEGTVKLYTFDLKILQGFLGNREIETITQNDLKGFFVYLREVYHIEKGHKDEPLSGATMRNFWKSIRSLYNWAGEENIIKDRPDQALKMPHNNPKIIMPLEEDEVKALLQNTEMSRFIETTDGRKPYKIHRHTATRDNALLILLLDTGLRAGEACRLNVGDIDLEGAQIYVRPYGNSGIKTKSRIVPLGKSTIRSLWKYKLTLEEKEDGDPFFVTINKRRMGVSGMLQLIQALGEKAGVKNCHPHRLRHTFAVEYLRNGGDIFTLKKILGHSSLDMVEHYLQLVQADASTAHRKASPADKWHL